LYACSAAIEVVRDVWPDPYKTSCAVTAPEQLSEGDVIVDANSPVVVKLDAGGLGPFAGGYGFGVRSTLLGYFMKLDAAWPMKGVFKGKPLYYFSLGFDF
jgi:hypothetical protein